jgi:hypothetical protein
MTGTVELKAPGSTVWRAARSGDNLEKETIISTGFKSTAILKVGSSTLTVRPLTRLSLEELLTNKDNSESINIGLRTGRLSVNVKAPAGSRTEFTVNTPVATASVRGTSFSMDSTNLRVSEGSVLYKPAASSGRPVRVNVGQSSHINASTGGAVKPQDLSETGHRLPDLVGKGLQTGTNERIAVPLGSSTIRATLYFH